jgi:hypothetical protein
MSPFDNQVNSVLEWAEGISDRCVACGGRVTPSNIVESHGETFDSEDCVPAAWRIEGINRTVVRKL